MENIIFIILFLFPGVFITIIYGRFIPTLHEEESTYNEVIRSFIISTFVLFFNILILNRVWDAKLNCWDDFIKYIKIYDNFIIYFVVSLVVSLLGVAAYWIINTYVTPGIINAVYRKKIGVSLETKHPSPWHSVFENNQLMLNNRPVGFFKGNELRSIGFVDGYPSPGSKKKDFRLINTDWLYNLYLKEESKDKKDKIFDVIDAEYYDIENDVLIKFYNTENFLKGI